MLYDSIPETEATPNDAIDYDELGKVIYQNTYNALNDYYSNNPQKSFISGELSSVQDEQILQFASSTDSTLYTVQTVDAPHTVAEQVGAYTLEIRNIVLIFLLSWLIITIYSKLKNSLYSYFGRS